MNLYRIGPPPRWWGPKLAPNLVRWMAPLRRRQRRKTHRVMQVEVHNEENLRTALSQGQGVMITPNHSSHADPYTIYDAAGTIGLSVFIMATWHVFESQNWLGKWLLQKHGCFSVDRDGADMRAFKEAVRILQSEQHPLVIFPEGEIYHCNDCITPYLEGPATIAMTAARRGDRDVVIVPCAMKYQYVDDPYEDLLQVMTELEQRILWRPKGPEVPLVDRIYHFSEAILSLKEIEYRGQSNAGPLPVRVAALADSILVRHEQARDLDPDGKTIPERVKEIRRRCVKELCDEENPLDDEMKSVVYQQLDDAFMAGQLFSYPGNYVAESPTTERLAETIDKFEEDVLQKPTAGIRGTRRVHISFGKPVSVPKKRKGEIGPPQLTHQMEQSVQTMLNELGELIESRS